MQTFLDRHKGKMVFLLLIGLILSLFLKQTLNLEWKTFLSDMFFCISIVFLLYGLWEFVLKVGFFNGLVFGTRCLKEILFPKLEASAEDKDDYIGFIEKRKKQRYIAEPLFLGGIFLTVSILVSIIL